MPSKEEMPFVPIVLTLTAIIIWAFLMMAYTLFWSRNMNWFQSIAIGFLSLVIVACGLGILWIYWVRYRRTTPLPS